MLRFVAYGGAELVLSWMVAGCGGAVAAGPYSAGDAGRDGSSSGGDAHVSDDDGAPTFDGYVGDEAFVPGDDGSLPDATLADDGGLPACDQGVCPSPADVSSFAPAWKPPTGAHRNACTTALIDEYYQDCFSMSGNCAAFQSDSAHTACQACLMSNFADSQWGPLVYGPDEVETNTSGCIALLDPGAVDCAQAIQAADQCQHTACDTICSGSSASGFDSWITCSAAANGCGCTSWFKAAQCVQSLSGAKSAAAPCLVGQTFQDLYYSVAAVFCGP